MRTVFRILDTAATAHYDNRQPHPQNAEKGRTMPDIPEKNPRLQKLEEQRQQLREKQKQEREQLNARIRDERKRGKRQATRS